VAFRPALWWTAVRQLAILAGPGWWRRWPPVPRPDETYLQFRLQTAYGDPAVAPDAGDIVTWLGWCKRMRAIRGRA
jgi:hypothetical protein